MNTSMMMLLRGLPQIPIRCFSTNKNFTALEVNDKTGIATLTMNRPPVNGLNLELLKDIKDSIDEVESNNCRGLILTSSSESIFSAGLDIMEMVNPEPKRLSDFWTALQDTWLALYGSSIPTAAAINGHAPAGGCLLACCCEYRVMLPKFTIGLNETKLGIVAPNWFMASFLNILSRRESEMALTQGKMFTADEAYNAKLIDSIAQSKVEAIRKCEEFLMSFKNIHPLARAMTKLQFRSNDLKLLENNRNTDLENFINFVNQPLVQKGLNNYLKNLKNKK